MWRLGVMLGLGRKLMGGWNRGLYARSGGLAEPRLPSSCGDCSLTAGMPASGNSTVLSCHIMSSPAGRVCCACTPRLAPCIYGSPYNSLLVMSTTMHRHVSAMAYAQLCIIVDDTSSKSASSRDDECHRRTDRSVTLNEHMCQGQ